MNKDELNWDSYVNEIHCCYGYNPVEGYEDGSRANVHEIRQILKEVYRGGTKAALSTDRKEKCHHGMVGFDGICSLCGMPAIAPTQRSAMPSNADIDAIMKNSPMADTAALNADHLINAVRRGAPGLVRTAFHAGFHAGRDYERKELAKKAVRAAEEKGDG